MLYSTKILLLRSWMNKRTDRHDPIIMSLFDAGRSKLNVGEQTTVSSEAI